MNLLQVAPKQTNKLPRFLFTESACLPVCLCVRSFARSLVAINATFRLHQACASCFSC